MANKVQRIPKNQKSQRKTTNSSHFYLTTQIIISSQFTKLNSYNSLIISIYSRTASSILCNGRFRIQCFMLKKIIKILMLLNSSKLFRLRKNNRWNCCIRIHQERKIWALSIYLGSHRETNRKSSSSTLRIYNWSTRWSHRTWKFSTTCNRFITTRKRFICLEEFRWIWRRSMLRRIFIILSFKKWRSCQIWAMHVTLILGSASRKNTTSLEEDTMESIKLVYWSIVSTLI